MKFFKKIIFASLIVLTVASCKSKYGSLEKGLYADIQTNKGDVLLLLHAKDVPMTVANFVSLAEGNHPKLVDSLKGKPFYDGVKFHRVIKDFMIQSGDPTGTGMGGSGFSFADEFPLDDKAKLKYSHDSAGVLSMANSGPATNSSQFFITHKETPWLNNKHSVFGKVQIGQSVVDSIEQGDVINKIDIIRVGKFAKKFDAPKVFLTEIENKAKKEKERLQKIAQVKEAFMKSKGVDKSVKKASGLKVYTLKKGNGEKFNPARNATMHYAIYLSDGTLIQSTEGKQPLSFVLNQKSMIPGVTEALKEMRVGDKKTLFIPYYLGYGERAFGPFPAKSDIVFDIELIKVGK